MPLFVSIGVTIRIAAFAALTVCAAVSASAQTAKDLRCRGCVGKTDIGRKAVTSGKIRNNAVNTFKIMNGAVTESKIGDGAVTGAKIQDGSVGAADLADAVKPAGADSAEGSQTFPISGTPAVVRAVVITAPAAGFVLATASRYFSLDPSSLTTCSISQNASVDFTHAIEGYAPAGVTLHMPFSGSRLYAVPAGNTAIYLVCSRAGGASIVYDSVLTALFVPNRY